MGKAMQYEFVDLNRPTNKYESYKQTCLMDGGQNDWGRLKTG